MLSTLGRNRLLSFHPMIVDTETGHERHGGGSCMKASRNFASSLWPRLEVLVINELSNDRFFSHYKNRYLHLVCCRV